MTRCARRFPAFCYFWYSRRFSSPPCWRSPWFRCCFAFSRGRKRINAELGFLFGFVYHLGLLQWLHHVTTGGMLALAVYLSLLSALTCYLIGWVKRFWFWIPLAALIWAGVEYGRSLGVLSFAWGYLGHGLTPSGSLLQITFIQIIYSIGVPGLSFFIFALNAAFAEEISLFLSRRKKPVGSVLKKLFAPHRIAFAVVLLAGVFFSLRGLNVLVLFGKGPREHTDYRVALVQGNFDQESKESASEKETLDVYLNLSEKAMEDKPDLIVWPESTITMPIEYLAEGIERIQSFADKWDVEMLIGSVSGAYDKTERKWRFWNNAFLFTPGTQFDYDKDPVDLSQLPSYSKTHLVPFGEWIPLGNYWPFTYIETAIEEAGAGIFQPGEGMTIFTTRKGVRFAVTICFESTLPRLWRKAKNLGADFIINITNDAWYKRSAGLQQHFNQCAMRAAENRIPVVRVANTGISGAIAPTGATKFTLPPFESTCGVYELSLPDW